jgi:hypothetical protein
MRKLKNEQRRKKVKAIKLLIQLNKKLLHKLIMRRRPKHQLQQMLGVINKKKIKLMIIKRNKEINQ